METNPHTYFSKKLQYFVKKINTLLFKLKFGKELLPKDIKSLEFLKFVLKLDNEFIKSDAEDFELSVSDDEDNILTLSDDDEDSYFERDMSCIVKKKFDPSNEESRELIEKFGFDEIEKDNDDDDDNDTDSETETIDFEKLRTESKNIMETNLAIAQYNRQNFWYKNVLKPIKLSNTDTIKNDGNEIVTTSTDTDSDTDIKQNINLYRINTFTGTPLCT